MENCFIKNIEKAKKLNSFITTCFEKSLKDANHDVSFVQGDITNPNEPQKIINFVLEKKLELNLRDIDLPSKVDSNDVKKYFVRSMHKKSNLRGLNWNERIRAVASRLIILKSYLLRRKL